MQSRHEDLRFSDQCHRRGRSRKSLIAMYLYNKNNNISIPHMYSYMSMRTRAYESPGDELRLLRDFPVGHSPLVFGHPAVAPRGPHTGPVSRRCVRDRPGAHLVAKRHCRPHGGPRLVCQSGRPIGTSGRKSVPDPSGNKRKPSQSLFFWSVTAGDTTTCKLRGQSLQLCMDGPDGLSKSLQGSNHED